MHLWQGIARGSRNLALPYPAAYLGTVTGGPQAYTYVHGRRSGITYVYVYVNRRRSTHAYVYVNRRRSTHAYAHVYVRSGRH